MMILTILSRYIFYRSQSLPSFYNLYPKSFIFPFTSKEKIAQKTDEIAKNYKSQFYASEGSKFSFAGLDVTVVSLASEG